MWSRRDELNRALLPAPFVCRFCEVQMKGFRFLLIHSLTDHPIQYVKLRDAAARLRDGQEPALLLAEVAAAAANTNAMVETSSPRLWTSDDGGCGEGTPLPVQALTPDAETPPPGLSECQRMRTESGSSIDSGTFCVVDEIVCHLSPQGQRAVKIEDGELLSSTEDSKDDGPLNIKTEDDSGKKSGESQRRRPRPPSRNRASPPRKRKRADTRIPRSIIPRSVGLSKGTAGTPGERCRHNEKPCPDFPFCLGRHCPRRHPLCASADTQTQSYFRCHNRNDCPFEHTQYEKTCNRCPGRRRPPTSPRLLSHCPHIKIQDCQYNHKRWSCRHGAHCLYVHGECPDVGCRRQDHCYYEHILGATYMCDLCRNLR